MSWDPWQREVLDALGHVVYRAASPEPAGADARVSVHAGDPLLQALLRAAARDADAVDAAALRHAWPPLASLRGDPAAKRALWPRLRALRARGATP